MKLVRVGGCLAAIACGAEAPERERPVPSTVSAQAQAFLRAPVTFPPAPATAADWAALRARTDSANREASRVARERYLVAANDSTVAGVGVVVATPRTMITGARGLLLHIHGGAYTTNSAATTLHAFAPLAHALGVRAISVDYRLAPEHPFPAALEDCLAVYRALVRAHRPADIMVLGESAGGALALAVLLRARAEGLPMPRALGLYSPWSDLDSIGDTYATLAGLDPTLDFTGNLRASARAYAGDSALTHPLMSPVYASYRGGFPRTLIQTGTRDLFLSNSVRQYQRLRADSVDARLDVWEGMWHVFEGMLGLPEAGEAVAVMAEFLRQPR